MEGGGETQKQPTLFSAHRSWHGQMGVCARANPSKPRNLRRAGSPDFETGQVEQSIRWIDRALQQGGIDADG